MTQDEIDELALKYLYDSTNKGNLHSPEDELFEWFKTKSIARSRVLHALDELESDGLVESRTSNSINITVSDFGNDVRVNCAYRITLKGIKEFESRMQSKAEKYQKSVAEQRVPVLQRPTKFVNEIPDKSIDWTKWGVIVALIIGAMTIAIMKEWL